MAKYKILVRKELKELSRERIVLFGLLLGPLIMYIILGGAASLATRETARQALSRASVAVLENTTSEPGIIARMIASALNSPLYTNRSPVELLGEGYDAVLILPPGFEENITRGQPGRTLLVYQPRTLGFIALQKPDQIGGIVESAVRTAITPLVRDCLPEATPEFLAQPVMLQVSYYYRGELVSGEQITGLVLGVSIAVPLALLMTAVAAAQVAAISFGLEKEAKTLEKLLTLPVTRRELLLGKLAAVSILAIGGVASYMIGFYIYVKLALAGLSPQGGGLSLSIPGSALIVLALGLALTLYTNIVYGFMIGSQAGDVRSSQMAASYLSFILSIPLFPMFFGLDLTGFSTPVKILLALDPYSLLGMVSTAGITGDAVILVLGTLGLLAHALVWTIVAVRLLSPEAMIVGHPLLKRISQRLQARR